jgi:LacI family transcriptional regulator
VACEVLAFAEEKKMVVPKDLSVIGFDDNPYCVFGDLMLTTVRQPLHKMAATAADILKDLVDHKSGVQKIALEAELVVRDTVSFV